MSRPEKSASAATKTTAKLVKKVFRICNLLQGAGENRLE